jgi:hypothetical protein
MAFCALGGLMSYFLIAIVTIILESSEGAVASFNE